MPKFPTLPTLYDDCKIVNISFLKKHGYLKPSQYQNGTITWSRGEGDNKIITAQISITVNTKSETPFICLNYKCNGNSIDYRVELISIPSNLGKGAVWFFVCPHTGKRCRKLYLVGEKFLHREAFKNCMYMKQTLSKRWRSWSNIFEIDKFYEQIYRKNFKKSYGGEPTKRYLKLLKRIEAVEHISEQDLLLS